MVRGKDPKIMEVFRKFVEDKYEGKPFRQFEATNEFFKWYFDTDLDLNVFKNMTSHIKSEDCYKHVNSDKRGNFYILKK